MKERTIKEGEVVSEKDDQALILVEEGTNLLLHPDNTWGVVFTRFPDGALDFEKNQEKLPPDEVFGPDDLFNVVEEVTFIVPVKLQAKHAGTGGQMVVIPQIRHNDGGVVAGEPFSLSVNVLEKGSLNKLRG